LAEAAGAVLGAEANSDVRSRPTLPIFIISGKLQNDLATKLNLTTIELCHFLRGSERGTRTKEGEAES
jgi:hypothetical protein